MSDTLKFPFYIKLSAILLILIGMFVILFYGQDIIFPILLSLLFAIILRPAVTFMSKRLRFPHVIAVIFTILIFICIFLSVLYFISFQVSDMANDWGKIKENFFYHTDNFQRLIRENFNLSNREQKEIINKATNDTMKSGNQIVGSTLTSFGDVLLNLTLIPIYTFLILYYQNHFVTFLCKLYKTENHPKLREILSQIKIAVQSYIVGLLFEMIAVSVLTSVGLYIIGVEYFILLGIITGLLNMIPYIGIFIAGILSIMVSLTGSTDSSVILGVIIVNVVVQLIDNNILVPMFVNSKVQINAFVSIVGIIIGNVLGGITGMFLAIPIIAIIKVIFDRIESLQPWGYLFGDDLPKTFEWHKIKIPSYGYQSITTTNTFDGDVTANSPTEKKDDNTTIIDDTAKK